MDNINEAPVVAAATKVVAGLAKAGAKAAAKGGKVAAKSSKNISKAASKFKRPNIKSYKNKETGRKVSRHFRFQGIYDSKASQHATRPEPPTFTPLLFSMIAHLRCFPYYSLLV